MRLNAYNDNDMSAPLGNQFGIGNSGGGRPSLKKEFEMYKFLEEVWEGQHTKEELEAILKSKKFGAKHIFAALVLTRNEKLLVKLMDKLFANKNSQEIRFGEEDKIGDGLEKISKLLTDEQASVSIDGSPVSSAGEGVDNSAEVSGVVAGDSGQDKSEGECNRSDAGWEVANDSVGGGSGGGSSS
jgi:hypothetical protein